MEPGSNIAEPVKLALQAMISGYGEGLTIEGKQTSEAQREQLTLEIIPIFSQVGNFRKKLIDLDRVMGNFKEYEELTEYIFDLLMLNFIASDSGKLDQDYLESEEWTKIEDETADRGTELLNLLIYISEAKESGIDMSLQDFLDEFLLADDEIYQDEYFIYEPVIRNASLTNANISDLEKIAQKIEQDEIRELFIPLMAYFNEGKEEDKIEALKRSGFHKALNLALYRGLKAYETSRMS